jgi:acetyltransferase-like isoleucine patch superfamily enzyme
VIGSLFWRVADPMLLRLRSRLEHLDQRQPSRRREELLRQLGEISPLARLRPEAAFSNPAPRAALRIGDYSWIAGEVRVLTPTARVSIGDHCYVGPGARIWAAASITVGRFVLMAHYVDILDNNSHSLSAAERRREASDLFERGVEIDFTQVGVGPVVVEDDVWIGTKTTILKGVRIGRGAVIAANSLVTHDVAPFTLSGGNPLRVLRKLPEEP